MNISFTQLFAGIWLTTTSLCAFGFNDRPAHADFLLSQSDSILFKETLRAFNQGAKRHEARTQWKLEDHLKTFTEDFYTLCKKQNAQTTSQDQDIPRAWTAFTPKHSTIASDTDTHAHLPLVPNLCPASKGIAIKVIAIEYVTRESKDIFPALIDRFIPTKGDTLDYQSYHMTKGTEAIEIGKSNPATIEPFRYGGEIHAKATTPDTLHLTLEMTSVTGFTSIHSNAEHKQFTATVEALNTDFVLNKGLSTHYIERPYGTFLVYTIWN